MKGHLHNGLYALQPSSFHLVRPQSVKSSFPTVFSSNLGNNCSINSANTVSVSNSSSLFLLWHGRLGHPSAKIVKFVLQSCNIPHINKVQSDFCSACCQGNIHKLPFPSSQTTYTQPLQIIHSDLRDPYPQLSSNGYRYYIHFIDSFSRYTRVFLLKAKSEDVQTIINFKTQVENEFDSKLKALQSDWEGEYQDFTNYLLQHGINHMVSCPTTHKQNSLAERKHRHLVDTFG